MLVVKVEVYLLKCQWVAWHHQATPYVAQQQRIRPCWLDVTFFYPQKKKPSPVRDATVMPRGRRREKRRRSGLGLATHQICYWYYWWWEWWWGELFAVAVLIQIRMEPLQCSSIMRAPLFLSLETCSTLTAATLETWRLDIARARDLLLHRLLLFQVHHANESGCTLVAMVSWIRSSFES